MNLTIWSGFHEAGLQDRIADALVGNSLLVTCPPRLRDFSFLELLPSGSIETVGDWSVGDRHALQSRSKSRDDYPEQPVLGVFTSGTLTGVPRLVLYSRRNLEASLSGILRFFDTKRLDSVFCYPQPFHTFGLVLGYVLANHLQLPLLAEPGPYRTGAHERWLTSARPGTLTLGTPTHFFDLIRAVRSSGRKPSPSYSAIVGGAPVPVRVWHDLRNVLGIDAPSIGYGCTEASPGLTHLRPGQPPAADGEIGVPLHNVRLEIHDGRGIEFSGEATCLAIVEQGELRFPKSVEIPDDLERRPDGSLVFRGRIGLSLNRGGVKYALEGIEAAIRSRLDVDVICVALPDERLGQDLGIVAATEPAPALFEQVRAIVSNDVGIRLQPERFSLLKRLPLNANGKYDRLAAVAAFQGIAK